MGFWWSEGKNKLNSYSFKVKTIWVLKSVMIDHIESKENKGQSTFHIVLAVKPYYKGVV